MDEPSAPHTPHDNQRPRLGGRRVVTALMVAGVLAAVPAGVALAGDSGGSGSAGGSSSGTGVLPVQSTTPDQGQQQDRGQGDRGDCPEKDGQSSQQDPTAL